MIEADINTVIQDFTGQEDDPIATACANVMDKAIATVLKDYGIPEDLSPDETAVRMEVVGLTVVEIEAPIGDDRAGIYIIHNKTDNDHHAIAYIEYPVLDSNMKIRCRLERYDLDVQQESGGIILPGNTHK